jgi:penicillin-binding protein 1A
VQGALVAIDPVTRGVRALVGGYDFNLSQFNRATQAHRQPGSAFKPFVWGTALETRRYTPASLVYDTPDVYRDPWTGKEWKPQNFERDAYDGPLLLGAALAHSKNTVSVKLVDTLGADAVIQFAHRAGIASELPKTLSLALGTGEVVPLEMVNAYATIAAQGFYTEPAMVLRVRDRKGAVLESHPVVRAPRPLAAPVAAIPTAGSPPPVDAGADAAPEAGAPPPDSAQAQPDAPPVAPPPPEVGMQPEVAFVLESMMREVIDYGTGAAARALGRPAAGKTGTAQDHRDAWFVGFSPEMVAGVWVGFDSHDPLGSHETGAGAALPAWLRFMQATAATRPPVEFQPPSGVEFARIDPKTGLLARDAGPAAPGQPPGAESRFMAFVTGTAPTQTAPEPGTSGAAPQSFFQDDH